MRYEEVVEYPNGFVAEWILAQFPTGYIGHAIDVGASDGVSVNTTFHLERAHKWNVLSVEANPNFARLLKHHRIWVEMCACAAAPAEEATFNINQDNPESFSALTISSHPSVRGWNKKDPWQKVKVKVRTVDQLLEKWEFPKLDALCVDVEGGEREVLAGCDLARWKPKVIVSEAWEHGSEYPYLAAFGYKLVAKSVHNDIYVREGQ